MSKLDPVLKYLAAAPPDDWSHLSSVSPLGVDLTGSPTSVNIMVEVDDASGQLPSGLLQAGFVARTRAGTVVSGDLPIGAIRAVGEVPGLKRAESSRALGYELGFALSETRALAVHHGPSARRGAGVIVGVIDSGIDYTHAAFRRADGSSRILAIWDQGAPGPSGGVDYGIAYERAAIDAALRSPDPRQTVAHADTAPFHGTHVASIAAAVAPDADLVVVANTRGHTHDPGSLGDSADTFDAVAYILRVADRFGRPVAINVSLGDNIGPHDGTSLLEVGIANLIAGPGRALIKSAGNEANLLRHASGDLSTGPHDVRIRVPSGQVEVILDFWYSGQHRIELRIIPPDGAPTAGHGPPFEGREPLANGNLTFIAADCDDPGNGDNRTFVVLLKGSQKMVQPGLWTFRLDGQGAWHGWIQRNSNAKFEPPFVNGSTTCSIPGTGTAVISVGSYVSDVRYRPFETLGALSAFSSHGPTRDGRATPTLSAPGEEITAAQPGGHVIALRGTSMAAPMVTGAAALLFEARPAWTASDVRDCLERTARLDVHTGPAPGTRWGAGKLDIEAACRSITP